MENSVIYGYGTVGQAVAYALGIKRYISRKESNISYKEAGRLRYHFICLPTSVVNGRYTIDDIRELIKQIVSYRAGQNVFILKSTVSPGTTRSLVEATGTQAIVHVPEFLSEVTWKEDAIKPEIIVIGGDRKNYVDDVTGIFKARYKGVDIIQTDSVTAECIKVMRNAFFSTKVIFANEMYEVAQKTGANYETIKNALYKSRWIGKNHLDVYYKRPDWGQSKRGIHGKCLPKDLEALAEFSQSKLLKVVKELNGYYKSK